MKKTTQKLFGWLAGRRQVFNCGMNNQKNVRIRNHLAVSRSVYVAHISHRPGTDIGSSQLHKNSIGDVWGSSASHVRYPERLGSVRAGDR